MPISQRDNPLIARALRRRVRVLGRERPRWVAMLLAGLLLGAVKTSAVLALNGYWPISAMLWLGIGLLIALALVLLVCGMAFAWGSDLLHSGLLDELYLVGMDRNEAAHGLLVGYLLPYEALALGLAASLVLELALVAMLSAGHLVAMGITQACLGVALLAAPFAGLVLRNAIGLYVALSRTVYEHTAGLSRWLFLSLTVALLGLGGVGVLVLAPLHVLVLSVALCFAVLTGDGVAGYLPQFREHPLFEDDEAF